MWSGTRTNGNGRKGAGLLAAAEPRVANPEHGTVEDLVGSAHLDRHGIPDWDRLATSARRDLEEHGVATIAGFLHRDAVERINASLDQLRPFVPIRFDRRSVYARVAGVELADDDPRRTEVDWLAGHATRDMFPPYTEAHRLYVCPHFKRFIARCVGLERVFEYADPLAGLVATILPPGGCYGWHYDTNEFVVTIAIQPADSGGRFEYATNLRTPGDENLEGLRRVLDGTDAGLVRSTAMGAGDLQLFLGRYSLHRVTEVDGEIERRVLVLSYADRPGVIGPLDRTRSVYGRVTEAHLVAADLVAAAPDGLIL